MDLITDRLNNLMNLHERPLHAVANKEDTPTATNPGDQRLLPDVVNISPEGKNKAAADNSNENDKKSQWQDLHKLATSQQDEAKAAEEDPEKGAIDAAIKKLEEDIRDLQERMEPLKGKDDEASKDVLEQLEAQLMALNIQLMELNNKKLEQIKADKA